MPEVQIVIDVAGESAGSPGTARSFAFSKVASATATVTLSLSNITGVSTFFWEIIDQPPTSTSILSDSSAESPTFDMSAGVSGTYLVRCTINTNQSSATNAVAITTVNQALRKMAAQESLEFDALRGWVAAWNAVVDAIDTGIGGAATPPGGSDGQIQYNNGSSFGGAAQLYYDDSTDKIGLRNTAPTFDIDLTNAAGAATTIGIRNSDNATSPNLLMIRSAGSPTLKTAVTTGDVLGNLVYAGHHGASDVNVHYSANIMAEAAENFAAGAGGTDLSFFTTAIGGTVAGRKMTLTAEGDMEMYSGGVKLESYNGTPSDGCIQWDGSNAQVYKSSAWVDLDASGGGGTLDSSYDYGGAGVGRSITADAGAVAITNAVDDSTNTLELTRSLGGGTPTGNALKVLSDLGTTYQEEGAGIFMTAAGTASQSIWSDQRLYIGSDASGGVNIANRAANGHAVVTLTSTSTLASTSSNVSVTANASTSAGNALIEILSVAGAASEGTVSLNALGGAGGGGNVLIGGYGCDIRFDDENRLGSTWLTQAYVTLSDDYTEWDDLESNCGGEVSLIQAINLAYAASGGISLDGAYDFGGAGVGRTITADSGSVVITNPAADTTSTLEVARNTGSGNVLQIQNDGGGYPGSTNQKSIFLTAASAVAQTIWSDKELYIGTSEPVLGMYLQNTAVGGALLRMQAQAVTTGNSVMWITADGATADNSTGYMLLQAAGAGTGGESKIEMRATAGSTGPGIVDIFASGGSAYVKAGGDNCEVRFNDENRSASTTWLTQPYITLSDNLGEWDDLESNCSGEVSLIRAINIAYAAAIGSGGGNLDTAYDFGGAGVGRSIYADAGSVRVVNTVPNTTSALELLRDASTTGQALRISDESNIPYGEAGASIFLTSTGTAKQAIWSDKSLTIGSDDSGGTMQVLHRATTGDSELWVASYSLASAGTAAINILAEGSSSGDANVNIEAKGSSATPSTVDIASTGGTGENSVTVRADGGATSNVQIGDGNCLVRLNDANRATSTWTGSSYMQLSASALEWSVLRNALGGETSLLGAISIATSLGGTLDAAYDKGGSGSGKAITADSGAVAITNTVADTTASLNLNRSASRTGQALRITSEGGTPTSEAGASIFLTSATTEDQTIWSDQQFNLGSDNSDGVVVQNRTASGDSNLALYSSALGSGGTATMGLLATGATAGNAVLNVGAVGTSGGVSSVNITCSGGTAVNSVNISASGAATSNVLIGSDDCEVRLHDGNQFSSSSWGQAYITLSDSSTEWTALHYNCGGIISLMEAINLAFTEAREMDTSARTTSLSITTSNSKTLYTNDTATGEVILTLPAAAAGLQYEFYVLENQLLQVKPASGDTIRLRGLSSAIYWRNDTVGDFLRLVAVDSTQWVATDILGSWTIGS